MASLFPIRSHLESEGTAIHWQWVLSLPFALRYRMAYDARLTGDVLNVNVFIRDVFIRALFGELRRRDQEQLCVSLAVVFILAGLGGDGRKTGPRDARLAVVTLRFAIYGRFGDCFSAVVVTVSNFARGFVCAGSNRSA